MTQFAGRKVVVDVGTDGATWNPVGELNQADMGLNGALLDVTKFGDDDIERALGLRDCQWTLSGFYDPTDSTGQKVIRDALLNNTALYVKIQFNPGGGAGLVGFSQQVICSKYNPGAQVAGTVTFSCQLDSTGPITAV